MRVRRDRDRTAELRGELEPDILPRQLRALGRVAGRLDDERPVPAPDFRARFDERIHALAPPGLVPAADERGSGRWRLWAAIWLGSGVALLAVIALLVALGEPGGR